MLSTRAGNLKKNPHNQVRNFAASFTFLGMGQRGGGIKRQEVNPPCVTGLRAGGMRAGKENCH